MTTKPSVWIWKEENNERTGNRPTAGSRFEYELPKGTKPFQVYSLGTPNGIKVAIMLEELQEKQLEADYDLFKIDIRQGDQFGSEFVSINPNSKIPAMLDQTGEKAIRVFESNAIVLYLAEKFHQFLPDDPMGRAECLNWVFWQAGAAPFVGGGFGHFFHYAPTYQEYPVDRYTMETKRQLDVLNQLLSTQEYIAGEEYTIADIVIWAWYGRLVLGELYPDSAAFLNVEEYPFVIKWANSVWNRPAVKRALTAEYRSI